MGCSIIMLPINTRIIPFFFLSNSKSPGFLYTHVFVANFVVTFLVGCLYSVKIRNNICRYILEEVLIIHDFLYYVAALLFLLVLNSSCS